MTTYQLKDGRTMTLINLDKYSVGMTTYNGEFKESYAIISKSDVKTVLENENVMHEIK